MVSEYQKPEDLQASDDRRPTTNDQKGRELALQAGDAAAAKNADDVRVLDVIGVFPAADYFVICSGRNIPQITAIARAVQEELDQAGKPYLRRQGAPESGWVLLDGGDVVVHIFNEEARRFYDLERLWGDAKIVSREP